MIAPRQPCGNRATRAPERQGSQRRTCSIEIPDEQKWGEYTGDNPACVSGGVHDVGAHGQEEPETRPGYPISKVECEILAEAPPLLEEPPAGAKTSDGHTEDDHRDYPVRDRVAKKHENYYSSRRALRYLSGAGQRALIEGKIVNETEQAPAAPPSVYAG